MTERRDYLFKEPLQELVPEVYGIIEEEHRRQADKLIMIPSESYAPLAVREALGSVFQNIYAEGYPRRRMMKETAESILDLEYQLAYYRRYADRRFYKGTENADIVEALSARLAAECFATELVCSDRVKANVQALSGSAANLSIYSSLMEPGDTIMGMDLFQGGHLTHGSKYNQSGKRYRVVSYGVSKETEKLDYREIRDLALEHKPKLIIAGFTSYPWAPDFAEFRSIADEAGAYLMADIAHTAGLVLGGVYPNPVGIADVTVFTTHKTLCGPRGAVILTTDPALADRIDKAVFPGAQGGPHVNKMAALCAALTIARTGQFRRLQQETVKNAAALAAGFHEQGIRVVYGGTDTHIVLIDAGDVSKEIPLYGETAARILDLAGIVVNKNTIPGDEKTALARGLRFGTPWVTQRGLNQEDMKEIARASANILKGIQPFTYVSAGGPLPRGKIRQTIFTEEQEKVRNIINRAHMDRAFTHPATVDGECVSFSITGSRAKAFLQSACSTDISSLEEGESKEVLFFNSSGRLVAPALLTRMKNDAGLRFVYKVETGPSRCPGLQQWLQGLSDGYTIFDEEDMLKKVEGPVVIKQVPSKTPGRKGPDFIPGTPLSEIEGKAPHLVCTEKSYFAGQNRSRHTHKKDPVRWEWTDPEGGEKRTVLYDIHKELGAKMVPFAGWSMPVWYTSAMEEHKAVRTAAGLFDVSHMACFEVSGPQAVSFLDTVSSNYTGWLEKGESGYGYLMDPEGNCIDDFMVYRIDEDRYLLVVNAANEAKDFDWLTRVNKGEVSIDYDHPEKKVIVPCTLVNLKDPSLGGNQLAGIALQGPLSTQTLLKCSRDYGSAQALRCLLKTELTRCVIGGIQVIAAKTGYTGEQDGFELYVHPDRLPELWNLILDQGKELGVVPCGLASRDSLRTEAGLPLYGHELAGPEGITPAEAGFGGYVKYHKPFFVGRDKLLEKDLKRTRKIVRWRMVDKGVRKPNPGDPLLQKNGLVIGKVTSCSLDTEGYLTGLAIVTKNSVVSGSAVDILPLPRQKREEKQRHELKEGDRITVSEKARVLSRFPERT